MGYSTLPHSNVTRGLFFAGMRTKEECSGEMKLTIWLMGFCQGRRWKGYAGVSNGCSLSCKRFLAHPVPWVSQSTRKPWTPSVLAPLGSAALAGLCGGGYLGALLGPPPYLVSHPPSRPREWCSVERGQGEIGTGLRCGQIEGLRVESWEKVA